MKRHPTTLVTSTAQIKVKRVRKCVRNSPTFLRRRPPTIGRVNWRGQMAGI